MSAGFYVLAAIFGILLISQFWTLANDIYDPRQAKRIFGFIGAGSSLGGATGAGLTAYLVERVGTENMLLVSAGIMAVCLRIVITLVKRERGAGQICITGAAAHLMKPGDQVIIASWAEVPDEMARGFDAKRVFVDHENRIRED